jgi:hypothetical protein
MSVSFGYKLSSQMHMVERERERERGEYGKSGNYIGNGHNACNGYVSKLAAKVYRRGETGQYYR